MRAQDRIGDYVTIGSDAALDCLAKLDQDARAVGIGITDVHRLIDSKIGDIRQTVCGIVDKRQRGLRLRLPSSHNGGRSSARGGDKAPTQELAAADIDQPIAFHGS
jgi:hypothetical protein